MKTEERIGLLRKYSTLALCVIKQKDGNYNDTKGKIYSQKQIDDYRKLLGHQLIVIIKASEIKNSKM